MKKKPKKYDIPFPVLYDTKVYSSDKITNFFTIKETRKLMNYKKGYFNYETNKFDIPKKDFSIIEKNPKMAGDYAIIKEVGYNII